jgi:hypothetical protein
LVAGSIPAGGAFKLLLYNKLEQCGFFATLLIFFGVAIVLLEKSQGANMIPTWNAKCNAKNWYV